MLSRLIEIKYKYKKLLNDETYDLVNYGKQEAIKQFIIELDKVINELQNSK